ncbi:MAG TPA: helix-turn-helix domain-containing protein [Polyangiaceae bacterium]|nr:helix-turn-helix domain-containing protein [Polyangiaceae bacterium]
MRARGRAAKVVDRVVSATAEELGRIGYAAMRVADVAALSGVHKTTIYRRWPTKAELVTATITTMMRGGERLGVIDSGEVRRDLRTSLLAVLDLKPSERAILRIMQVERAIPEVNAMTHRFRDELHRMRVSNGAARYRSRRVTEGRRSGAYRGPRLCAGAAGPHLNETVDASYLDRVLDVVLTGVATCAPAAARSAPKRAAKSPAKARPKR